MGGEPAMGGDGGGPNASPPVGTTTAIPKMTLADRVRRIFLSIVYLL
jgi:hypothetical protein